MAERKYYTDNNWQTETREEDAEPRVQLADGRWIRATDVLQGDQLAKGELERGFDARMFGGGSPDPMTGAVDYMQQQGLTPQQYQQATGGLPFAFNADGTTTLDLGERKNTYSYEAPDDGWLAKIGPYLMSGMVGAGMTGLLPGTTNAFSGLGDFFSGMNPFGGAAEGASATGGTLASGGGLPSNYWSMMADAGGSTMFDAGVPGIEALSGGGAGSFADSAMPWLTESGFGAPGAGLEALAQAPAMGGYGGLETALGSAYGGAGSIPAIQSILQGTGAAGMQAAAPGILQQLSQWMGSPVMPGGNGGGNQSNATQGTGPNWGQLLAGLGSTALGYKSAQDSADRTDQVYQQAQQMAQQDQSNRQPFVNQATSWMSNPASFWGGDFGQEIARQTSRQVSGMRQENLYDNPTGQSLVMQSLAPQWLNSITQMANQGLRNTAPLGELSNIGLSAANAAGQPGAVLGSGFANVFGDQGTNQIKTNNDLLRQILAKQQTPGTSGRLG